MNLDPNELGYFITQVGLSAASFGVTTEDVTTVGQALGKLFGYRCAPPTVVVPSQGAHLQSICQADTCPLSPNDTCKAYTQSVKPGVANATLAMGEGTNSTSNSSTNASSTDASSTGTSPSATPSGMTSGSAATMMGISLAALGAAAFALAL